MFKKLVYSLLTKISVALINFAILLISSRYLGVNSRGEISIFILNITIIQIINEIYTGYSIVHFIPKFNFKKVVGVGVLYSILFCSLSNALFTYLNKQVPGKEWLAYVISLLVILNTFNCVLILGKQNLRAYNFFSFFQPFVLVVGISVCIFGLKIYTLDAFIYPLLFSFSLAFLASSIKVISYFSSSVPKAEYKLKPILISGVLFQSASLLFIFSNRFSYYILPTTAEVGLYSSVSSLMESVLIIVNGFSPVLLSRLANQNKQTDNVEMTLTLAKASLCLSIALVIILFFIPDAVFIQILGNGFVGIKSLMLYYSPAVIFASFFIALSNYFIASGNQKVPVICYGLGFLSSVLLAPWFIQSYGIKGAAFNANLSYFIMCCAMCVLFLKINTIELKRFISFRKDMVNLKALVFPGDRT